MAIRFKNRKNKLLALFMAMMMASGTAAMAACNDGDDSSSSDDTTTDSTVVETDTSRINNGSFEFVNWNNGKNLIVTSPTGWSRSTNSASSGTAVSSKSASGIINTEDKAWDNFTKSKLPEGTAAPKTADEARALWSQMSAYDKLAFYKAWDEADYDEDVSKQDFYDSAKDKFNVDIDDVPVYKDYKETDTTKQIKPIANPGTHSGTEDDNVLMIHNAYTNGVGTAQKYTSSSTITLQAGTSAKVSLWVKTSNLTYDDGKEVLNERGAYIGITHTVGGKTLDQMQVKNINTEAMENTDNGWVQYTFYLQGCSFSTSTFTMVLGLGQTGGTDRFEYVEGYAFFDDVECTVISNDAYGDAMEAANGAIPEIDLDDKGNDKIFRADKAAFKNVTTYALNLASSNTFQSFNNELTDPTIKLTEEKKNGLTYVAAVAPNTTLPTGTLVYNGLGFDTTSDKYGLFDKDGLVALTSNEYVKAALENGFGYKAGENNTYTMDKFPFDDTAKTLMILSAGGANYTAKMENPAFVLDAGKKMAISFFVKTSDMLGVTGANVTVRFEGGSSTISTINTVGGTTVDVDGDDGKDIYKGWQQCFLFIENDTEVNNLTFSLEFSYGTSTIVGSTKDNYIEGWTAFTNFQIAKNMEEAFDYASSGTYSKTVSLADPDEATFSSAVFDAAENFTGEEAIKSGLANPNNYVGVKSGSRYVKDLPPVNTNDKQAYEAYKALNALNSNAYAGMFSKEYVDNYVDDALLSENSWVSQLGLKSAITDATFKWQDLAEKDFDKLTNDEKYALADRFNALTADERQAELVKAQKRETKKNILDFMGNSTQPLLIYNKEASAYGFIAETKSSISGYSAISVRVKVDETAKAFVYLIDMDDDSHETVLSIDRRVSYWYDKDGNVCDGDPAEKATKVVLELKSNGLYQKKGGGAYYANLKAYTEKDASGNLLVADGGVSYKYNNDFNGEGLDGIAFYHKDGKYYADAAKTVEVKDFADASVPTRYTAADKQAMLVEVGNTNGQWKTVTFFVAAGATAKNYRLEVWNGSRDGLTTSKGTVLFDTNTAGSLDATSYKTLTDLAFETLADNVSMDVDEWKETNKNSGLFRYNAYSFFDDPKFLRYNGEIDENKVGNSYDDYDPTADLYAEVLSYLYYQNDAMNAITVFANFTQNDVNVPMDVVEEDTDTDAPETETPEGETNWGLLISSLAVAGVLVAVLAVVGVRKFMKWGKKVAVTAKPVKAKPAKAKKEKPAKEEIAENEDLYND